MTLKENITTSYIVYPRIIHVWQSRVEIKHSIAYLDYVTAFKVL